MAFTLQNFQFGRGVTTQGVQGQGVTPVIHSYKSEDTLATINADNYFPAYIDGTTDKVFVDDLLLICASDGTNMVRIDELSPFTYGADLFSASGSSLVVGAPEVGSSGDGANIDLTTLHMEYANATNPGILSTGAQNIAGVKTFGSAIAADAGLIIDGGSAVLGYYDTATFSTTFFNNTVITSAIAIKLVRVGDMISFSIPASNTSGAQVAPTSSFTSTSLLPVQWRPQGEFNGYWPISKNGVESRGEIYIDSTGAVQIFADVDNSVLYGDTTNIINASAVCYNRVA